MYKARLKKIFLLIILIILILVWLFGLLGIIYSFSDVSASSSMALLYGTLTVIVSFFIIRIISTLRHPKSKKQNKFLTPYKKELLPAVISIILSLITIIVSIYLMSIFLEFVSENNWTIPKDSGGSAIGFFVAQAIWLILPIFSIAFVYRTNYSQEYKKINPNDTNFTQRKILYILSICGCILALCSIITFFIMIGYVLIRSS